ncbi:hypothetical protein EON62_02000 [archaeon]|nr:MAG: hypothetical protein EON62_02000 [archaeon]
MPCARYNCPQPVTQRWYVPAWIHCSLRVGGHLCGWRACGLRLQANDYLGRAYAQSEQDEEAVRAYSAALELVPMYPPYLARRAAVFAYVSPRTRLRTRRAKPRIPL